MILERRAVDPFFKNGFVIGCEETREGVVIDPGDEVEQLLEAAREFLPRLSELWVDAGYQGRGKECAEQEFGLSVEVVRRTPKPTPEKIARIWAEEWAKEGQEIDWQKLLPQRRGFELLPRRWVVERTFSWLSQNRRMSKDYERLCATSETFIYAVMTRIMVRRTRIMVRRLANA